MPGGQMSCTPSFSTVPATTGAKSHDTGPELLLMAPLAGVAATTVGAGELNSTKIGVTAINNILPNKNNIRSFRIAFSSSLGTMEIDFVPTCCGGFNQGRLQREREKKWQGNASKRDLTEDSRRSDWIFMQSIVVALSSKVGLVSKGIATRSTIATDRWPLSSAILGFFAGQQRPRKRSIFNWPMRVGQSGTRQWYHKLGDRKSTRLN